MDRSHRMLESEQTEALRQQMIELMERLPYRALPFSEWMELALYHPKWGYYMRERSKLGLRGDFYTNAHIGDLWGKVLARQIMLQNRFPVSVVEIGAGDGRMVQALLQELAAHDVEREKVLVYLWEVSPEHRRIQQIRLQGMPYKIEWVENWPSIDREREVVLYANELLDAFPVWRISRIRGELREEAITIKNGCFQSCHLPLRKDRLPPLWNGYLQKIPADSTWELPVAAIEWWKELWSWFPPRGTIYLIDYGITIQELIAGRLAKGSLRAYRNHRLVPVDYNIPGEMDLTTHVLWDPFLEIARDQEKMTQVTLQSQATFLTESGILEFLARSSVDPFSKEAKQNRRIIQLLYTMGESFQVLCVRR